MISQILRNAEAQSRKEAEAEKLRRRYRFLYFVVSLVVAILALVLFTVTEQHTILIAAMTAIFGFAGGLGVGKLKGRRIDRDQPVNQTITLPSAEKPAKPPEGNAGAQRVFPTADRDD